MSSLSLLILISRLLLPLLVWISAVSQEIEDLESEGNGFSLSLCLYFLSLALVTLPSFLLRKN